MNNYKLLLAYDGTCFLGWQKTKMGPSIEDAVQNALKPILSESPTLQAASRTDAGVHAKGQVVNFFTTKELSLKQINALLPVSISALALEKVPKHFHPTLDAVAKEYHYQICYGPVQLPIHRITSWHVPYALDIPLMEEAAKMFEGTHNFSAFCNRSHDEPYHTYERRIEKITLDILPDKRLCFQLIGTNFLYKMVRNIVGTLVAVGRKKIALEDVPKILNNRDRTQAGMTAPSHGLTLNKVFYSK